MFWKRIMYVWHTLSQFELIYILLAIHEIIPPLLLEFGIPKTIAFIIPLLTQITIFKIFLNSKLKVPFSGNLKIAYICTIFLTITCIIIQGELRGTPIWTNTINYFTFHFISTNGIMGYLIPLCILIGLKPVKFNHIIKCTYFIFIFGSAYFLYLLLNHNLFEYNTASLDNEEYNFYLLRNIAKLTSLILLLYPFIREKKYWYYCLIIHFFALFYLIFFGRRAASFELITYIIGAGYFILQKISKLKSLIFIICVGLLFTVFSKQSWFDKYTINMQNKLEVDNRSEGDRYFIKDVFNSTDLFFGRGINGQYYHPGFTTIDKEGNINTTNYRYGNETGYFNMILHGGLFYTLLYVLILLYCAILGFFDTNNDLTKAFSIYIFIYLITLYGGFPPTYNVHDFLMWFGAVICSKKRLRYLNNNQISRIFKISI